MTPEPTFKKDRSWARKFRDALVGIWLGVRGQSSYQVHVLAAVAVVVTAALLRVNLVEWCLLILCITIVMVSEMFNSALEWLAPAVDREHNDYIAGALDVGSAAVLLASIGASIVGGIIFVYRAGLMFNFWASG